MRLSEKYEFRSIHREEAEQAAEIEQICFPPAEAISRADVIDRVEKIPELFLVAVDRKNGRSALRFGQGYQPEATACRCA